MRKSIVTLFVLVVPVAFAACEATDAINDALSQDNVPVPQVDRKEACEMFRSDLCTAIQACDKLAVYGFADVAACKTWFDENVSNCGGCDKTQADMLTLALEAQLDTCLTDTTGINGTDCATAFPDAENLNVPASCETYGTAAGAATCI